MFLLLTKVVFILVNGKWVILGMDKTTTANKVNISMLNRGYKHLDGFKANLTQFGTTFAYLD